MAKLLVACVVIALPVLAETGPQTYVLGGAAGTQAPSTQLAPELTTIFYFFSF